MLDLKNVIFRLVMCTTAHNIYVWDREVSTFDKQNIENIVPNIERLIDEGGHF